MLHKLHFILYILYIYFILFFALPLGGDKKWRRGEKEIILNQKLMMETKIKIDYFCMCTFLESRGLEPHTVTEISFAFINFSDSDKRNEYS